MKNAQPGGRAHEAPNPTTVTPALSAPQAASNQPYADVAAELYARGLACLPCGGPDGKRPLVSGWNKWRKPPDPARFVDRHSADNVGVVTGPLSGVTVVDIDDPTIIAEVVERYGQTPLLTATPSGGVHLWYRAGGEGCANLRDTHGLAVDIKGRGGFVVVPPSRRSGGRAYQHIVGEWSNIPELPRAKRQLAAEPVSLKAVQQGFRNSTLYRALMREIAACDDMEALLDVAHTINGEFPEPLSETEIQRVVKSVAEMTAQGRNWCGTQGQLTTPRQLFRKMRAECPDALVMLMDLSDNHAVHGEPFAISPPAMHEANRFNGWSRNRYRVARDWLIQNGAIEMKHRGGRGPCDPHLFALASQGSAYGHNTNITPLPPAYLDGSGHRSLSVVDGGKTGDEAQLNPKIRV